MEKNGKVLMNKYEFGKKLGQGNFAKVYHARDLRTGDNVAIKVIDKEKVLKVGMRVQIMREISIMRKVKHPNVLHLYEVLATKTKIYLVLEYAKGGDLSDKIDKVRINENQARKYFQQLISALDFCHKKGVYHRDLKPENLLLDENGVLKIADFGLGTFVESHDRNIMLQTLCGTPDYVAPEVVLRKGYYGEKADVWSSGLILFALLARGVPFYDLSERKMHRNIIHGKYNYPSWFSIDVKRLLTKILNPNPSARISTAKIMENPWFRKGLHLKTVKVERDVPDAAADVESDKFIDLYENESVVVDLNQDSVQPKYLNAFHILSLSARFDLSVLFERNDDEIEDIKFTSMSSASSIISTIEDIAHILKMKIVKNNGEMLKLERPQDRPKGPLTISAEIFEFAPSFFLVELKKSCGDALEYQKILEEHIRPALKDIVWIWQ